MKNRHKLAVAQYFSQNTDYWKSIYKDTENLTNKFFQVNRRKKVIIQLIDSLPDARTLKILDIGCGSGGIMSDLVTSGYSVIGGDISWHMVREARDSIKAWSGTAGYLQCDVEHLPFATDTFDVIVCAGVLSYLSDLDQGLQELHRILKCSGILVVTLPNLLRLNVLFDPYYPYKLSRLSGEKLYQFFKPDQCTCANTRLAIPEVHKYIYGQLSGVFRHNGYQIQKTISLGFGPLTVGRKQLLSSKNANRMNNVLERLANKRHFSFLNVCANHWVIFLQRV